MEQAEENDCFSASVQLTTLKAKRDTSKIKKAAVTKARGKGEAKVDQLLKDKAELKLMHQYQTWPN